MTILLLIAVTQQQQQQQRKNGSKCVHLPPQYVRVPYDISESTERLGFDGENVHILTTPMTIMNICPLHINTRSDIFHRSNA